jgi:glycerol-3-phosphate dehydrogenase (NAD(P)+)
MGGGSVRGTGSVGFACGSFGARVRFMTTVAVLGAGSWGTALAKLLAEKNFDVRLWARHEDQARAIQSSRVNERYLPGFELPASLSATSDLKAALAGTELVLWVVPSHGLREVLEAAVVPSDAVHCAAIKGIENDTLKLVSEIFQDHFPKQAHGQLTFLGGPSFAKEVAQGMPTAVSVAGKNASTAARVQQLLQTERFRPYATEDVVGVELGGALKNVVAIAAGIADGLGFGHNTRAAIITRGLAEISRLAVQRGANPLTMMGLGGVGDLVLTCTGDLSRNRTVGISLGKGRKLEEVLGEMTMVAEGVRTAKSAHALAAREDVDMPIVTEVYRVLYEGKNPREAVAALMTRPLKHERQ